MTAMYVRVIGGLAAWTAGAVLATALSLFAVSALGEGLSAEPVRTLTGDDVTRALQAAAASATAGTPSQAIFDGRSEIKHLYVDPQHKRRGIGRALLETMAARLVEQGRRSAAIGVVAGNGPAIAFYEAQGGRQAGSYTDPGPLWRSHNLVYAWDDLEALVRRQPVSSAP